MISIYPDIKEDYLAVIKHPMDLVTLSDCLQGNSVIDEEDYYVKVISIFQNAVDFNSMKHEVIKEEIENGSEEEKDEVKEDEVEVEVEREEDPLTRRLVSRSAHLAQYAKWLCLEALPVVADKERENR